MSMTRRPLLLAAGIAGIALQAALVATLSAQGGRAGGAPAAPRGRSITLGDVTSFDVKDTAFTIAAGADQVRVIWYRDNLFRIWLGPDGEFTEAQPLPDDAQMVVYHGARMAMPWRDAGEYYRIESKESVLRVYKRPLRFALFDKDNATVIWQETDRKSVV